MERRERPLSLMDQPIKQARGHDLDTAARKAGEDRLRRVERYKQQDERDAKALA